MKLIPVCDSDAREIMRKRAYHKLQNIILEFQESTSDISLVSVDPNEYTQAGALSGGLRRAAKRLNVNVQVIQSEGKVYLTKEK